MQSRALQPGKCSKVLFDLYSVIHRRGCESSDASPASSVDPEVDMEADGMELRRASMQWSKERREVNTYGQRKKDEVLAWMCIC